MLMLLRVSLEMRRVQELCDKMEVILNILILFKSRFGLRFGVKYIFCLFLVLSPHVYGEDQSYIERHKDNKTWDHFELIGLLQSKGPDRIKTDDSGNMVCKYISDPIIIKMKGNCGNYCYAGVQCRLKTAKQYEETFSVGSGAFCKTDHSKKCPDPVTCFRQSKSQSPKIQNVQRATDHTAAITSYTSADIEAKELTRSDDMVAPHGTANEQIELARKNEAAYEADVQEANMANESKTETTSKGSKTKKSGGGGIFGGIFNFFRCLFGSDSCKRSTSSGSSGTSGTPKRGGYDHMSDGK